MKCKTQLKTIVWDEHSAEHVLTDDADGFLLFIMKIQCYYFYFVNSLLLLVEPKVYYNISEMLLNLTRSETCSQECALGADRSYTAAQ